MSMPTPEQAQELVAWAGGLRAAARTVPVSPTTIHNWLYPERQKERLRKPEHREAARERAREYRKRHAADINQRQRERYYRRRDAGLCTDCGEPRLSEVYCWDCLNKREERRTLVITI